MLARVSAWIDSRPVPRIRILSVAATTATGQPPELHRPLPAEILVTDAAHRLAMITAARAPARGATDAWGMAYLFVNSSSSASLLDPFQQRPAHGTRSSSRRRRDIFASAGNDDRGNDGQRLDHGHLEPAMAADALVFPSLNTVDGRTQRRSQIDEHFEANGHGYPRPTRDQTDAPAPSPTPARATGSASHEERSASGSRSSPDAASRVLNLFCVLVSGRRRRRGSLPGARPGV